MSVPANEYVNEVLRKVAARATFEIADRRGVRSGQIAVLGYPKSGTSWLASLFSAALSIPEPSFYRFPVLRSAVLHGHVSGVKNLPVAYIVRDPRDVFNSLYYHQARILQGESNPKYLREMQARYSGFPAPLTAETYNENIRAFVELELSDPRTSRMSWGDHVQSAHESAHSSEHFAIIRFEDLLEDTHSVFAELVSRLGRRASGPMIEKAVNRNRFELLSGGREKGKEDNSSFFRAGVAGAWKSSMPEVAAEMIPKAYGETMRLVGYQ